MDSGATSATTTISHARPVGQTYSVGQIAERLFAAYGAEGGKLSLAGCTLEDRPLLQLVFRSASNSDAPTEWALSFDAEARPITAELTAELGLADVEPCDPPLQRIGRYEWETLLAHALSAATAANAELGRRGVLVSRSVVWCKEVSGKLRFTFDEAVTELPFGGWARSFVPPPYICPHTGVSTFRLALTSDGRIFAAEQLAICARTGRRMPRDEMAVCSITGKTVLSEYVAMCPVTTLPVLAELFRTCAICQQRVGPAGLVSGTCRACRGLSSVTQADPRMARLLGEYPRLEHWRRWRLAETLTAYIARGAGVFKRLLLVVDKATLEPLHMAEGNRLTRSWTPVAPADRNRILRQVAE